MSYKNNKTITFTFQSAQIKPSTETTASVGITSVQLVNTVNNK